MKRNFVRLYLLAAPGAWLRSTLWDDAWVERTNYCHINIIPILNDQFNRCNWQQSIARVLKMSKMSTGTS